MRHYIEKHHGLDFTLRLQRALRNQEIAVACAGEAVSLLATAISVTPAKASVRTRLVNAITEASKAANDSRELFERMEDWWYGGASRPDYMVLCDGERVTVESWKTWGTAGVSK